MIYIEFKTRELLGLKKAYYARAFALIIRELIYLQQALKLLHPEVTFDYKIIIK